MINNVGFCTIPSNRCTNKIEAELRVGIKNPQFDTNNFSVDFIIEDAKGNVINRINVSEPQRFKASNNLLFSAFLNTRELCGSYKILPVIVVGEREIPIESKELNVIDCSTKALPLIDSAWIEPGCYCAGKDGMKSTPDDVEKYMELLASSGIHTMIIAYIEVIYQRLGAFYPTSLEEIKSFNSPLDYDYIGTVMKKADELSISVFMGLGRGEDLQLTWDGFDDIERVAKQIEFSNRLADDVYGKYGHHKSFYGWYIAHEADEIERANVYYNPVSRHLHSLSPEKPVLIAPSGTPVINKNVLNSCDYDIIAYQDAVGSGYIPYKNTFEQENRIKMLPDCYKRYSNAHIGTRKHIWTDMEIWKMDGPDYSDAYAAEYKQIIRQIEIERPFVESISAYAFPGMYEDKNARFHYQNNKGAEELCEEYRAYYDRVKKVYGI